MKSHLTLVVFLFCFIAVTAQQADSAKKHATGATLPQPKNAITNQVVSSVRKDAIAVPGSAAERAVIGGDTIAFSPASKQVK